MGEVVTALRYRPPLAAPNPFFTGSARDNEAFAIADLARSGLEPSDLEIAAPPDLLLPADCTAGYLIPYYDLAGRILKGDGGDVTMYRIRLKYPEWSRAQRYTQPSGETLIAAGLPSSIPYFPPLGPLKELAGSRVLICEGEKKTLAAMKHLAQPAFGIGGAQNWRNPRGQGGVHPWITDYLAQLCAKSILIVPDADILRYDICVAYGSFAHRLKELGYTVEVLRPPDKLDDWIMAGGTLSAFEALPRVPLDSLVQSPAHLAERLDLAFTRTPDGVVKVPCHTSNLTRVIENSGAFPRIWRNVEDDKVYIGDEPAKADCTEVEIANHLQHYMGFHQATHTQVRTVMGMLSEVNGASPLLDQLRRSHWDGVHRLDSWGQDYWGIEPSEYTRTVLARWLMASCARLANPGVKFDWMLVMIGPTGTGKTMMPSIWWGERALTLIGNPRDTDLYMLIHSALCINFDELDFFTQRDATSLLSLITRQHDAYRRPYGAAVVDHPRRAVFYGCGNQREFMPDHEAFARRFGVIEVDKLINYRGLQEHAREIWAEAWHRYQQGEDWWKIPPLSAHQRDRHTIVNVEREQIIAWIETQRLSKHSTMIEEGKLWFTMTQLLEGMQLPTHARNPQVTKKISGILGRLGIEQQRCRHAGQTSRWYSVDLDTSIE